MGTDLINQFSALVKCKLHGVVVYIVVLRFVAKDFGGKTFGRLRFCGLVNVCVNK